MTTEMTDAIETVQRQCKRQKEKSAKDWALVDTTNLTLLFFVSNVRSIAWDQKK